MQSTTTPQLVSSIVDDLIRTTAELNATTAEIARMAREESRWEPWLAFAAGAACALVVFAALY